MLQRGMEGWEIIAFVVSMLLFFGSGMLAGIAIC